MDVLSDQPSSQVILGKQPWLFEMNPLPAWRDLGRFSLPSYQALPPKEEALELVNEAFQSFNRYFPLFDENDFMQQFHDKYSDSSPKSPAWWACINVTLSMAHRFRAMRTSNIMYENGQACGYVHNALAVVSELNVLHQSLPAVQALLGLAIILQGSPSPQAASVLTAAAVRLGQSMGLHRSFKVPGLTDAQTEQRRRVFWIAYFLDKDISLRMGQSFAQDDDDMDAELPSGALSEVPMCNGEIRVIDFFNTRIGLAVIQGQIYKRLYSVQAARQSEEQKAVIASELSNIIGFWKQSVSVDFEHSPESPSQLPLRVEFLHLLLLRFAYINCLVMIDRHLPPVITDVPIDPVIALQETFIPHESVCIVECRKAVRLIQGLPFGDYACIWYVDKSLLFFSDKYLEARSNRKC